MGMPGRSYSARETCLVTAPCLYSLHPRPHRRDPGAHRL